jgi:hypothetical protein
VSEIREIETCAERPIVLIIDKHIPGQNNRRRACSNSKTLNKDVTARAELIRYRVKAAVWITASCERGKPREG